MMDMSTRRDKAGRMSETVILYATFACIQSSLRLNMCLDTFRYEPVSWPTPAEASNAKKKLKEHAMSSPTVRRHGVSSENRNHKRKKERPQASYAGDIQGKKKL